MVLQPDFNKLGRCQDLPSHRHSWGVSWESERQLDKLSDVPSSKLPGWAALQCFSYKFIENLWICFKIIEILWIWFKINEIPGHIFKVIRNTCLAKAHRSHPSAGILSAQVARAALRRSGGAGCLANFGEPAATRRAPTEAGTDGAINPGRSKTECAQCKKPRGVLAVQAISVAQMLKRRLSPTFYDASQPFWLTLKAAVLR